MLRYKTETRPGLVALYDIRPGNGVGPFLQPQSPHEAFQGQKIKGQLSGGGAYCGGLPHSLFNQRIYNRFDSVSPKTLLQSLWRLLEKHFHKVEAHPIIQSSMGLNK